MSDQKTPETSLVLQWALLLDVALADFKVSRFGDSHDALNDTENLRRLTLSSMKQPLCQLRVLCRSFAIIFVLACFILCCCPRQRKDVFQNEIVKESLINLLMSDQKTPETSLVLQWALLLDVALADFKVSRFGDSHDALNDTENLWVRQPRFQDESVSFPKTVWPVNDIATSAAVQDSGRTIGNYTVIWSKATSYTICKNCISERDSQRKPDKSSYVGPEEAFLPFL